MPAETKQKETATLTDCPGCGEEIVVFPSGSIGERRTEPIETGIITDLISSAFKEHYCDANDREFICHGCHTRYEDEEKAEKCCRFEYPRKEYSLVSEYDGEYAL